LGLAEGGLRLRYEELPSLAALAGANLRLVGRMDAVAPDCGAELERRGPALQVRARGQGSTLRVWFAGDSTTAAVGVAPEKSWWARLGIEAAAGRPMEATNYAVPGSDFCVVERQVEHAAKLAPAPDWLFVGVYADDLVGHQLLSVEGRPVLLPSAAPERLRWLVTHVYLANLVWLSVEPRRQLAHQRSIDPQAIGRFREAMTSVAGWAGAVGARLTFVLHPPAGLHECPAGLAPDSTCRWLQEDLGQMAAALARLEKLHFSG
jgi:hypothetical protein